MKKVPAVLAIMALIALPILAAPKPTPTPAANSRDRNNNRKKVLDGKMERVPAVTPSPTAGPAAERNKGTKTMGDFNLAAPVTPTAGPVGANTKTTPKASGPRDVPSGQASGREAAPTCARLVNGKIEHYPCPEGVEAKGDHSHTQDFPSTLKEGAPVTPTPTIGPAKATHFDTHEIKSREAAPGTPTPTVGPVGNINLNSGRTNIERQGVPVTPTPTAGPVPNDGREKQKGTSTVGKERHPKYVAGRVLSQQGRRLTVQLSDGNTVAVDGSDLNPAPRVGSTVTVTNSRGRWVIVLR